MDDSIRRLDDHPWPHPLPRRLMRRPHTRDITPDAEQHQCDVEDRKPEGEIVADQTADHSRRHEHLVEAKDILLDGVRRLRDDEQQERRPVSASPSRPIIDGCKQPPITIAQLERLYASAPINDYFRPELRVSEGQAEVTMPVRRDFFHAAQAIHGAVYFKALDDAAFFAVASLVTDVFVLTVTTTSISRDRFQQGTLRAVGRVVHRSRQLFLAEAELFTADGKQAARGSGSFMRSASHGRRSAV